MILIYSHRVPTRKICRQCTSTINTVYIQILLLSLLLDLAEVVLKNNIFTFGKKTLKQKRGTAIGTKFAPPYSILFMAELEEEIVKESECKPYLWWRYIDDIFFLWEHGENKLKSFIDKINKAHPTIKFTAEWSKTSINFLDVTVSLIEGVIETD